MIQLEDVRQSVITTFKSYHDAINPTVLVNYPNYTVVDIERQKDPFVNVELDLNDTPRAALGEKEILVRGVLHVYYYFRDGSGMAGAYEYADSLNQYISMSLVDSVQYEEVKGYDIQTFPGWKGRLNSIKFNIVDQNVC